MNLSHKLNKLAARAMLMLGLTAGGAAWAQCAVTLVSVTGNQAVLQANCGVAVINGITWRRNGVSLNGASDIPVTSTSSAIHYTTSLISGPNTYTASGNGGAVAAGVAATIATGEPSLTVAVTGTGGATGTITSTPVGFPALNCPSNCTSSYASGTAVTLTAVGNQGFSFAGWSGDCSGVGACVVVMTAPHTVLATFASTPVCTLTASPGTITVGSSATLTANCTPQANSYTWTGAACSTQACTVTPSTSTTYTVTGTNANGGGSASSPVTVTVNPLAPSCTLAASPASVVLGTLTPVTLTATCTGSPSYAWATTAGNPAGGPVATGTANTTSFTFAANALAGNYIYTVTATNITGAVSVPVTVQVSAVTPPVCTPTASLATITAGGSSTLTANCPTATSYVWTGGTCVGAGASCTASPTVTTSYTVAGILSGVTGAPANVTVTVSAGGVTPPAGCTVQDVTWARGLSYNSAGAPPLSVASDTAYKTPLSHFNNKQASGYSYGLVQFHEMGTSLNYSISASPCAFQSAPPAGTCQALVASSQANNRLYVSADSPPPPDSTYCQLPPLPSGQTFYYVNVRPTNTAVPANFFLLFD